MNQREVGADTQSFKKAPKYILRQDPDVVLIGRCGTWRRWRRRWSFSDTGHLAFATLHTNSAVRDHHRILDVFPPYQQPQVRAQLSFVLEGVLTQNLLPRAGGPGRVLVAEVMVPNPAIRNLIREARLHQVYSQMQVGQPEFGMQTFTRRWRRRWRSGLLPWEEAMGRSSEMDELEEPAH